MTLFLVAVILVILSPFLYLLYEIARDLRLILRRLTKAEFQFDNPEPPQVKAPSRRQLKG